MPTYIFIDDTGSSGSVSSSSHISSSRVTWAAVLLTSEIKEKVEEEIQNKLIEYNDTLHLSEFHFTNIYSGKNEFKDIDPDVRLDIFDWFVNLYNKYKPYPVEFAAEILLSTMDKAAGENWCNFEESLVYINFNS